jgi:S1-C subfamily serine protease
MNSIKFCSLLFLSCILCSCTPASSKRKMPRLSEYKVSVESGGKKVENPTENLLKRIRIRSGDIMAVFGSKSSPKIPSLSVARAYDGRSSIMGLEIAKSTPVSDALGLQVGDIITAVGVRHVRSPNDLMYFGRLFDAANELSFTYERKGVARKTILYRAD